MNYSSIPTVKGPSLRRSETNNLVETRANPFSFISQQDGKRGYSLQSMRNMTYNATSHTNGQLKDALDFENIIQQNDLIKFHEDQWGQDIEVEQLKLIFSDRAYQSYFNYSFLTHMLNVKYDSQLTTEKILIQSKMILRKATRGGPRDQGPRSIMQRVATTAEKIGFNYGLDEDTLYAARLETAENQAQHQNDLHQQISGAMLAILHAHAMHLESRMMNILPMDYGALWAIKNMNKVNNDVDDLYTYQHNHFESAVHATQGPFFFDHLSRKIAKETEGEYDMVVLSTLPIYYGNQANAVVVPSLPYLIERDCRPNDIETIKQKIKLSKGETYKPSMGTIGSDPKTTKGVDTNVNSVLGNGQQRYITLHTFATPNQVFVEDIKRPNYQHYHHEDVHMNAHNSLKMYMLRIDYDKLKSGKLECGLEETDVGIRIRSNPNSRNLIQGSIPPATKFGNLFLNINRNTGDFFQPQVNQPGDTRSIDLHAEVSVQFRNMTSIDRRYPALLCPVYDFKETVSYDLLDNDEDKDTLVQKILIFQGVVTEQEEMNIEYVMEHEPNVIKNYTNGNHEQGSNILAYVPLHEYVDGKQNGYENFFDPIIDFGTDLKFEDYAKEFFFFQFKSILKHTVFGQFKSHVFEPLTSLNQTPKYVEKLQTMMADDPVFRRLNMKAAGSYKVDMTRAEAAHLLFKAAVYYHFICNNYRSWGDWGTVKFDIEYPKPYQRKRTAMERAAQEEALDTYFETQKQLDNIKNDNTAKDLSVETREENLEKLKRSRLNLKEIITKKDYIEPVQKLLDDVDPVIEQADKLISQDNSST